MKTIEVGTKISRKAHPTRSDILTVIYGKVIEIGTGKNEGRSRVQWRRRDGSDLGMMTWTKTIQLTVCE